MKIGILLLVLFFFLFSTVSVLAQSYGYRTSGFVGLPSISELATNEWFNATILFLIVFAFCWFVLQQVFKERKGIAAVLSILIALIGSLGVIYTYGPIMNRFGNWLIIAIFLAICILLWFEFRKSKILIFLILSGLALFWLLWARNQLCPPAGIFPHEVCVILDTIAVVILIISFIKLLTWLTGELAKRIKSEKNDNYYVLTIGVQGNGRTNPAPGNYQRREHSKIKVRARANPGATLDHWELDGTSMGASPVITVLMDNNHTLMAIFTGETEPPEKPPRIRFVARPSQIKKGEHARLLWTTMRADYVEIAEGTQLIAKKGPKGILDVAPKQTTTYYATAVGPGGSTQAAVTIVVGEEPPPPPRIRFVARPSQIKKGEHARLLWTTMRADYVEIAEGTQLIAKKGPKGILDVAPKQTTTYYATAVGPGGSTQAAVTIVVGEEPPPPPRITLTANPSRVGAGAAVTLKWHAENAERVILALEKGRQINVGISGTYVIKPLESFNYAAIAINSEGKKAIAKAHVEVMKAITFKGAPKIVLTANPPRVGAGAAVTLKWHAENAERVILALEKGRQINVGISGTYVIKPLESFNYAAIAINSEGKKAIAKAHVEILKALPPPQKRKAIAYEEKKMLPPPAEINRVKQDLIRVQSLIDREMKKGAKANRQRINKLIAMRDRLKKRLHELR